MQSRVVACAPVPNACPGSMTIESDPASAVSHGGPIQSGPILTGLWKLRQASSHPRATGLSLTRPNALQAHDRVLPLGVCRQLDLRAALPLLEALGKELDHGRARFLRPLARHGDRHATEIAQRNADRSLPKRPPSDP